MREIFLFASLALGGCNFGGSGTESGDLGCLDLPVQPPAGVNDLLQSVSACVERNAALFAKGPDTPDELSKAVIARCQDKIMEYVTKEAKAAGEAPQYEAALEAWRQRALPVIAEARARGCYS